MVNVGILGIGFMGVTHYKAIAEMDSAAVTAICTRDEAKRNGDWQTVQGNFGDSGGVHDLSQIATYAEIDDLLADDNVDLVDICLPTGLHADIAVRALEAGKHVLVEKPIAFTVEDADRMIAAAAASGKLLAVAHVLRFFPEFRLVKDLCDSGNYGALLAANFKRMIARPEWWSAEAIAKSGGPLIDLHIHDADFVQYLFGMPNAVDASGLIGESKVVDYVSARYIYEQGQPLVTVEGGWLSQSALPFEHGYDLYFEEATLKYNSTWGAPPKLYHKDGTVTEPTLSTEDGFVGELAEAVAAIESGQSSALLGGESARNSLQLCLKADESVRAGKVVPISG